MRFEIDEGARATILSQWSSKIVWVLLIIVTKIKILVKYGWPITPITSSTNLGGMNCDKIMHAP